MDADLSHPPGLLGPIVRKLKEGFSLVLPSRYRKGGGAEKWPVNRKIISLGATTLALPLIGGITDPMSGFFGLDRRIIRGATLNPAGFKILLEILVKGRYARDSVAEIPYIFRNRHRGTSKLTSGVSFEYLKQLLLLYRYRVRAFFRRNGKAVP